MTTFRHFFSLSAHFFVQDFILIKILYLKCSIIRLPRRY